MKIFAEILSLSRAFEKLAKGKTLYHGTSLKNARNIMNQGAIYPQVGHFVETSYGHEMDLDQDSEEYYGISEENRPIFELTFAADKGTIGSCIGGILSALSKELNKSFHPICARRPLPKRNLNRFLLVGEELHTP
jgi:hypothetical protein